MNILFKFLLLSIGLMIPGTLHADCAAGSAGCDKPQFRIILGSQFTYRPPDITYQEKGKASPRKVEVRKSFAEDNYLPFPFMNLEYQTSPVSFWSLTYDEDKSKTAALTEETIKLLFFPIKFRLKIPGEVDTQSLKIFYNRAMWQNEAFEIGGSLGLQVLHINARADKSIFGNQDYEYIAPLPAFGVFAAYRPSDRFTCRLKANYFSIGAFSVGSVSIAGISEEIDFSLEYQYAKNWLVGAGYRVSYLQIDVDAEDYRVNGSHVTHGPKIFLGASF